MGQGRTRSTKSTILDIDIARVDKCIGASGAATLAPFMPSITVPPGSKPAPEITCNNRSATHGREDSSKLSLASGISAIDNDASSSEVAEAFQNAVKTSTDGTLVADIPDLYDTCA